MDRTDQAVTKEEKSESYPNVGFFHLFRFANCGELVWIMFAILCATLSAGCWPLILIAYGEFSTLLVERSMTFGVVSNTPLLDLVGGGHVM